MDGKIKNCWRGGGMAAVLGFLILLSLSCEKKGLVDPTVLELERQVHVTDFTSSSSNISLDGGTADLSARIVDGTGEPFEGGVVTFNSVLGASIPADTSDADGMVHSRYTSGSVVGVDTVTAEVINAPILPVEGILLLNILPKSIFTITANPTEITADGSSTAEITVVVKNSFNNPIENAEITFSTTLGRIAASAATDENGIVAVSLFSERTDGVAVVTAEFDGIVKTTQVRFTGSRIELTAQPEALVAGGSEKSAISVTLLDGAGLPFQSTPVTLRTDNGTFTNDSTEISGNTDVNGVFIDSLKSGIATVATVTAESGVSLATTQVTFTSLITTLTPDAQTVSANDSVRLTFTIVDINGAPQKGAQVAFFTTLGEVFPPESVTDSSGHAYTYLKGTIGGDATVTAQVLGGLITPDAPSATVTILSAPPTNIRLIVDPVVVAVGGGTTNLTAIISDENGNPVPDKNVSFKIIQGPGGGESIDPALAKTDATGSARSVFTAGSIGSDVPNSVVVRASLQEFSLDAEAFLTVAGVPKSIKTSPSPPPTNNEDGTFSLKIGSIVSDINGNPVKDGTLVHYSTSPPIGVISSPVSTISGKASTELVYPIDSAGDSVTVIATSGEISSTLIIKQLPTAGVAGFVDSIKVLGTVSGSILADGQSTTQFRVVVIDPTKNPVAGVIVDFLADPGNSGTGLTESQFDVEGNQNSNWGVASFDVQSESFSNDVYPTIKATAGGKSIVFQDGGVPDPVNPFFYRGIAIDLETDVDTVIVGETIDVRTVLKETTSSVALAGRSVTFGSNLGLIANEGTTDNRGEIIIPFEAGNIPGMTTITATFGTNIADSKDIYIRADIPQPPANIFLSADTTFIRVQGAAGLNSTGITARVTDAGNNPVAVGTGVQMTASLGTFALTGINNVNLATNADGEVQAQLVSGTSAGIVVIEASSGALTVSEKLVTIQAGNPDNVIISADTLGTILAGNLAQISVAAIITDLNGNPVASGIPVLFEAGPTGGGPTPVVSIIANSTTDDFGIARSTLTYTVGEIGDSVKLDVTSGSASATKNIVLPPVE